MVSEMDFLQQNARIEAAERDRKEAAKEVADRKKQAKEVGLEERARKEANRLSKLSQEERIHYLNTVSDYLRAMQVRGHEQLIRMQSPDPTSVAADAHWYCDGFSTRARGGDPSECPHDTKSGAGIHWLAGFDAATKQIRGERVKSNVTLIKSGIKELDDAKPDLAAGAVDQAGAPAEAAVPAHQDPVDANEVPARKSIGKRQPIGDVIRAAQAAEPEEAVPAPTPPPAPDEDVEPSVGDELAEALGADDLVQGAPPLPPGIGALVKERPAKFDLTKALDQKRKLAQAERRAASKLK